MSEKKQLNEEELEKVAGGVLSDEAFDWLYRHLFDIETCMGIEKDSLTTQNEIISILEPIYTNQDYVYSTSEVKQIFKEKTGISFDDFN